MFFLALEPLSREVVLHIGDPNTSEGILKSKWTGAIADIQNITAPIGTTEASFSSLLSLPNIIAAVVIGCVGRITVLNGMS